MKISVKQVLSESAAFYKENFKKLIGISFFVFMFIAFTQVVGITQTIFTDNPSLLWLFIIVIYAIGIPMIIVLPKLYLAMLILINSFFGETKLTSKQAYRQTKGKYWLMIGCSLLIGILFLPITVIIIIKKIPFASAISTIYTAFITSLFYTMHPMIAIEPKTSHYLRKSTKMIKGNYFAVLILTFITVSILTAISGVLTYIFRGKAIESLVFGAIYAIAYFFIYPFVSTVTVIVYRQLKESQEPSEPVEIEELRKDMHDSN